ncbi:hypothetical protein [Campylobacter sp. RM16192]|uniref:hypothetical protein n=1 Tax=Campylobacter sp. RM16192 TaxID=1660080 RepID=UPI001451B9E9|nr:hypothetical protein [Campylobacter sp. RM16192]QCD52710.1 hypothetical protein CDOMC_1092 [Campylobacter sp. RM16192]
MKKSYFRIGTLFAIGFLFFGCSMKEAIILNPEARAIPILREVPAGCEFISEVEGRNSGNTVGKNIDNGGYMFTYEEIYQNKKQEAYNDLKNKTAYFGKNMKAVIVREKSTCQRQGFFSVKIMDCEVGRQAGYKDLFLDTYVVYAHIYKCN